MGYNNNSDEDSSSSADEVDRLREDWGDEFDENEITLGEDEDNKGKLPRKRTNKRRSVSNR